MALRTEKIATTFVTALLVAVAVITVQVDGALAQNPELGDESEVGTGAGGGASAGASWSTGTQASGDVSATETAGATFAEGPSAPSYSGDSDHSAMVENFGIGFFGVMGVPIAFATTPPEVVADRHTVFAETVQAPTIGLRYWLSDRLGVEGALGIGIRSESLETTDATGATASAYDLSATALVIHGGVPLALAYSGHFVFEVVPELNFGFSSGTVKGVTAQQDVDVGGLLVELGARAGAEIHFGFIDIPQLALQGSVGFHLTYQSRSSEAGSGISADQSGFFLGTSWREDPWDLFTGNVAAIYYFP